MGLSSDHASALFNSSAQGEFMMKGKTAVGGAREHKVICQCGLRVMIG